jgi:ribonucleotide reductase beta subunit family protein with ferritin-like domain
MEDEFIDVVFKNSPNGVEGLTIEQLKRFIRHRANVKLGDLGLKSNWKNIGSDVGLPWFDVLVGQNTHTDFFALRSSDYSKAVVEFTDDIFE